ncbi:MAG: hypothetical protein KC729_00505 [Candidatus Eisenbacteria bacterium]|uniref:Uncharacterized protein n=1 Tax=Eiseniibacteriota bacterium TaxID=2212470 RepID=A0A956RM74_UNCEI|nr:hypothetical protein [Candidatus Eisenbacteria bacterium]
MQRLWSGPFAAVGLVPGLILSVFFPNSGLAGEATALFSTAEPGIAAETAPTAGLGGLAASATTPGTGESLGSERTLEMGQSSGAAMTTGSGDSVGADPVRVLEDGTGSVPAPTAGDSLDPTPFRMSGGDRPPSSSPERPLIGLPIDLPQTAGVKDPIFSILVGLVEANIYGTLTRDRLKMQLERRHQKSHLPYDSVREVTRLPKGDGRPTEEITVHFDGRLKLPIPYSILGYNPGSFRASERCVFREWDLGTVTLQHARKVDDRVETVPVVLENVHLFGLDEGEVSLDIDGWLDRMMGGNLDDTDIVGLMLCRYQGKWMGVAMGYNKDHRGRSGALDFGEDKVVFPSPDEIKTVGRTMRSRVEGFLTAVRAPSADRS